MARISVDAQAWCPRREGEAEMGHFDSLAAAAAVVAVAARPSIEQPRRFYHPVRHGTGEAVLMLFAFIRRTTSPPILFNVIYFVYKEQIEHRACL